MLVEYLHYGDGIIGVRFRRPNPFFSRTIVNKAYLRRAPFSFPLPVETIIALILTTERCYVIGKSGFSGKFFMFVLDSFICLLYIFISQLLLPLCTYQIKEINATCQEIFIIHLVVVIYTYKNHSYNLLCLYLIKKYLMIQI
jgi:hypothetical protein